MKKMWKTVTAAALAAALCTPFAAFAREKVILDSDMVDLFDDGVAMMMLAKADNVELLGVTTVFGNTWAETGTASAIRQLEGIDEKDVPVYMGVNDPTKKDRFPDISEEKRLFGRGFDSHLGSMGYAKPESWQAEYKLHYKADPEMKPQKGNASDFIVKTIKKNPGEVTLVVVGSAANLAEALHKAPEIAPMVKRVVYMAGAFFCEGNVMPNAEFNVWIDPETAKEVYRAPWTEQIFLPLDVCRKVRMDNKDFLNLEARIKTDRFKQMWENHYATPLFRSDPEYKNYIWDVLAAAVVIDPTVILEEENLPVDVNDQYGLGYGQTLAFHGFGPAGTQNARIVYTIDQAKVWRMVEKVFDIL